MVGQRCSYVCCSFGGTFSLAIVEVSGHTKMPYMTKADRLRAEHLAKEEVDAVLSLVYWEMDIGNTH